MIERMTTSRLRAHLARVLDRVLATGQPVEVERKGRVLRIEPVAPEDRLARLRPHPEAVRGDLEALVHVDWSGEWKP